MSAQPASVRAMIPIVTALAMVEPPPRDPDITFWLELARNLRQARDRLQEAPDKLTRRCEFLLYSFWECLEVRYFQEGGELVPHAEVIPEHRRIFNEVVDELKSIPRDELLRRIAR